MFGLRLTTHIARRLVCSFYIHITPWVLALMTVSTGVAYRYLMIDSCNKSLHDPSLFQRIIKVQYDLLLMNAIKI